MGASCSSPQAATPSQNVNLEDGLRDHRQSLDFDELYDDDGTKVIGRSGTTVVTRATRRSDGVSVAVKVIPRGELSADPSATERIVRECKLHKRLRHRNIVQLFDVFVEPERIRFVMEVCAGGDLHDGVRRFGGRVPDAQARSIMRQTLAAVAYLHANGVIHRDIKVENVLLTNNTSQPGVKLADFGYSKELSDLVARAARSGSVDGRPGSSRVCPRRRRRACGASSGVCPWLCCRSPTCRAPGTSRRGR